MSTINLPENFWCLADAQTEIELPYLSSCLAIIITLTSHLKICVHLADLPGFPSKTLSDEIHPLPIEHHGYAERTSEIFQFLIRLEELNPEDIKQVSVVGQYNKRADVFKLKSDECISYEDAMQVIAKELSIDSEKIILKKCAEVNLKVKIDGSIEIKPQEEEEIDKIEQDNFLFHRASLDSPPVSRTSLLKNHALFRSTEVYAQDDTAINYQWNKRNRP